MESATAAANAVAERVSVSVADGVADVRLTRPDKHNGLDFPMFEAINDAIDEVGADNSIRAVVLSGEGKSFCAGLDFMAVMAAGKPIEEQFAKREGEIANAFQRVAYGWQQLDVPVIAALQGNVPRRRRTDRARRRHPLHRPRPQVLDPRDQVGPDPGHGPDPVAAEAGRRRPAPRS